MEPFNLESESITAYLECMDLFLAVNDVLRTVAIILSTIGGETYGLLRQLCSPNKLQTKTYAALSLLLKGHFEPKPLVIAERFHFHKQSQQAGETIAEYLAELRRLAATCNFGEYLQEVLRDRLVCGIQHKGTQ